MLGPVPMPVRSDESLAPRPPASPETALWRAVLVQARRDLEPGQYGARRDETSRVIAWLGTADFVRVCFNADLDPDATEAEFRKTIEGIKTDAE